MTTARKEMESPITSRISSATGSFEDLISTQNSDELYFSDAFPHMQSTIRQGDISPAASTRRSQAFHRNPHKLRDSDDFSATSSSVSNSMLSQSGLGHEEDGENEEGSGCNGWQSLADGDIFCATNPIATMNMDQSPSTEDLFQELSKPEDIWMEPDTITDEVECDPCYLSDDAPVLVPRGRSPTKSRAYAMEDDLGGQDSLTQINSKLEHPHSRLNSFSSDACASESSFRSSRSISLPALEAGSLYKRKPTPQNDLPGYLAAPLPSQAFSSYRKSEYEVIQGPSKRQNHFSEDSLSPWRPALSSSPSPPPPAVDDTPTASLHLPASLTQDIDIRDLVIPIEWIDPKAEADGGFASIHIGSWSGSKVAVKVIHVSKENERVAQRCITREIVVWKKLRHPNITPLLGIAYSELSKLELIVTPWYDNGSLTNYLSLSHRSFDERLRLSLGVAIGLSYLHGLNPPIVHGDLKPSNVLVDHAGQPKLCDFGLARIIEEARSGLTTTTAHSATPLYIAPEILDGGPWKPTTTSDVYSLGSLLYELLTGNLPYAPLSINAQIYGAIWRGRKPATRPKSITEAKDRFQWELFEACWSEPEKRPDVFAVLGQLRKVNQSRVSCDSNSHQVEENRVTGINASSSLSSQRCPRITHIHPTSGSTFGGTEVTLLGEYFSKDLLKNAAIAFGTNLVWFHGPGAESAQVRSDTELVCTLPPSSSPEPVPVTLHGISTQTRSKPPIFFYTIPGTLETENWLN